jgi:RimJ/RimL family protein N-acetyltransferase
MSKPPGKKPAAKRRKPARPTPKPPVILPPKGGPKIDAEKVSLIAKSGHKDKGDGPGGEYWDVVVDGERAGEVFVNVIDEQPVGRHASLQIFLNQADQGKGIGRVAYRMAAEASAHDPLYLHMRKSNHASRLAAEAAGFVDASPPGTTQLILKRDRGRL